MLVLEKLKWFLTGAGITLIVDKIWWKYFSRVDVVFNHYFLGGLLVFLAWFVGYFKRYYYNNNKYDNRGLA